MNVVDSSGWLEYLADGPGADSFVAAIENADELIVPAICMAEVARVLTRERDEHTALQALALMEQSKVVEMDVSVMLGAACLGVEAKLPLADSIILATARAHDAILWTQDDDFKGLTDVRYFPKRPFR